MHKRCYPVFLLFILTACGGGSDTANSAGAPPATYTATLEVASAPGASPSPAAGPLVLYNQQFLDFFHNAKIVTVAISPQPPHPAQVTWTSSNGNVVLQPTEPNFASPAPTAPPGGVFAAVGTTYGASTITASIGAPVNQTLTLPTFHYASLSFGCRFRYTPAFSFDAGATANGTSSDLYATIGSDQVQSLDPCYNDPVFLTAAGTPEVWHTPYGGVLLRDASLEQFPAITASQWSNTGTEFTAQPGSILIFKTKAGSIVKALLPIGPFEVSGSDGTFVSAATTAP